MQRTISISTPVFAAIWAQRKDGEDSEDSVLARLLGVEQDRDASVNCASSAEGGVGVYDNRNNVFFPQGFKAFRRYKRHDYEAVAGAGVWLRADTGETYPTLNQLNKSIAAGPENVWNGNWKFRAEDGALQPLDALRRTG